MSTSTFGFAPAVRVHGALTAGVEKRLLVWVAGRMPGWVTSDQLTGLGFLGQVGAGVGFGLAGMHRWGLWVVIAGLILNWFGDSLDGTLARVRGQLRPRFGFYVDHMLDSLGSVALMGGLAASGMVHWQAAMGMLVGFLLLAAESFLATHTFGRFEMSQGWFGPTEIRLLLVAGVVALMRSPFVTVAHHRVLLFDLGGGIAAAVMLGMVVLTVGRRTVRLYREEPLG